MAEVLNQAVMPDRHWHLAMPRSDLEQHSARMVRIAGKQNCIF